VSTPLKIQTLGRGAEQHSSTEGSQGASAPKNNFRGFGSLRDRSVAFLAEGQLRNPSSPRNYKVT